MFICLYCPHPVNSQYSHLSPWCLFCQWTFHSIGGNQRQRHKTMPLPLQCERAFSGQIFNISYIAKVIAKCKGTFIIYSDVRNHSHWVCDSSSRYWGFYLFFLRVLVSPHLSTHTEISFITVQTQKQMLRDKWLRYCHRHKSKHKDIQLWLPQTVVQLFSITMYMSCIN